MCVVGGKFSMILVSVCVGRLGGVLGMVWVVVMIFWVSGGSCVLGLVS